MISGNASITDPLLDSLQFAYRANRSVDDAVNMALHFILQHLDSAGTYARILFVDFSYAFNTIMRALLQDKLSQLSVPDSICRWITDFLSDRRQHVRLGKHVSDPRTISTGSPPGWVLSPLLFSLYTNSCTSSHQSVKLLKFADDTTLIGLISGGDESAYRWEIDHLVTRCGQNNLELNALKTVEMVVDFRKNPAPPTPITPSDSPVDSVESIRFLGTIISQDLKWELNIISLTKKAHQRMYFLCQDFKRGPNRRSMKVGFIPQNTEDQKGKHKNRAHDHCRLPRRKTKSFCKLTVQKVFLQGDLSRQSYLLQKHRQLTEQGSTTVATIRQGRSEERRVGQES